jgi:ABC-type Mn2+/Zn2+ transport system ATPase subunit
MDDPLLEYQNVDLGYGRNTVLHSVNFSLRRGDFLGIVGPNGAGKTTLLRSMFGMLRPIKGKIIVHSRDLRFGYVPQRQDIDRQFPLTALELARMGHYSTLGVFGRFGHQGHERVSECLERVGMYQLRNKPYRELSGGQKQRVLIARALVSKANVLLLDEPTHDMDIAAESEIMGLIWNLHKRENLTVILVTHLLNLAGGYAQVIAILKDGKFIMGKSNEILQADRISGVYGIPVYVETLHGRTTVTVRKEIDSHV